MLSQTQKAVVLSNSALLFPASNESQLFYCDSTNMGIFSDNDLVGNWLDLSGNGRNAVQATTSKKPIYKTGVQAGKPGVRFDPTDDALVTTLNLSGFPFSIMAIYSYRGIASADRRALSGGTNNWLIGPYGLTYQVYNGLFVSGPAVIQNQAVIHIVTQISGQAVSYVRSNGRTFRNSNSASGVPGIVALGQTAIAGAPFDGDMFEVRAFNKIFSPSECDQIIGYGQTKWSIA